MGYHKYCPKCSRGTEESSTIEEDLLEYDSQNCTYCGTEFEPEQSTEEYLVTLKHEVTALTRTVETLIGGIETLVDHIKDQNERIAKLESKVRGIQSNG